MNYKQLPLTLLFVLAAFPLPAQTIYEYDRADATVLFFNKGISDHLPHLIREYEAAKTIHEGIWNIDTSGKAAIQPPMMMVRDFADDGNAGVSSIPKNIILMEVAPTNFSYFIAPSPERFYSLFRHEYTHTVMTDKTSQQDRDWRAFLGGKFSVEPLHPFSAAWSFLAAPRWYTPRWYQESIACFMETWLCGGVGRALGGYDEMYFRSIVDSGEPLYSVVGLETEGSSTDFQMGTNSYLYGTRFINYLEYKYGLDKILAFYNRTEDSERLFNNQFEKVYGKSLRDVWDDWRAFEYGHQKEQIETLKEYPLTQTTPLSDIALGSMSPMAVDEKNNCAYYGANYPGDFAHIERLDLKTLERTKVANLDGAMTYQSCYITLDKQRQRLYWTTQNGGFRGIAMYDIAKKKTVKYLKFQRMSELLFDNVNDCLYSIMTNQGAVYLCKYDPDLEDMTILYNFPFGISVFDLALSNSGEYLTATTSGRNGEQNLIRFDVKALESAAFSYETLYSFQDSNLGQFRFAPGDSVMVGSSYYTGVSNIWQLNLNTKELDLLSNTTIGLFSPQVMQDGNILALQFERNGMRPVTFKPQILHDANAVEMLGQKAYEAHSEELEKLGISKRQAPKISFGEVYDSIKIYSPFKSLKFTGAYPEISGFRDRQSWNNVTPVLGYRMIFQDPLGLNTLKMSVGMSPWSHNDPKNQYHADIQWDYWGFTTRASWNPTSFYDLVGPIQASRKGWNVSLAYNRKFSLFTPASYSYGAQIAAYGMMDALPMYQNVETTISSFQTAYAYFNYSKTRASIGAASLESGYTLGADAYTYYADGKFYPTLSATFDFGFPIPGLQNTCLWFRNAAGQNFGNPNSVFGNEYFGGFGNNWVDYRASNRYRTASTFAGVYIDEIEAHNYVKSMAELCLKPIRYNDVGWINLYPTLTQVNFFGSALATNPWTLGYQTNPMAMYYNVGVQINTQVVLFKFMSTVWSVGYARAFRPDGTNQGDFLISVKLL